MAFMYTFDNFRYCVQEHRLILESVLKLKKKSLKNLTVK